MRKLPADYPIYGVESGHHRLVMSISAFDPKRTLRGHAGGKSVHAILVTAKIA
jgi:hypothetical protein